MLVVGEHMVFSPVAHPTYSGSRQCLCRAFRHNPASASRSRGPILYIQHSSEGSVRSSFLDVKHFAIDTHFQGCYSTIISWWLHKGPQRTQPQARRLSAAAVAIDRT